MSSPPCRITIELPAETVHLLDVLVARCNDSHRETDGGNTHGELTVQTLLAMLAEDVGLAVQRPGSWEGANMTNVLAAHGYDVCR